MATSWTGWVNPEMVVAALGRGPMTGDDDAWLTRVCGAVNVAIARWRPDLTPPVNSSGGPFNTQYSPAFALSGMSSGDDPMVRHGAVKLALQMYARRGVSDQGEFGEFGGLSVGILDPEVQAFIGIGRHHAGLVA